MFNANATRNGKAFPKTTLGHGPTFQKKLAFSYDSVTLLTYTHFAAPMVRGSLRWQSRRRPHYILASRSPEVAIKTSFRFDKEIHERA